MGGAFFREVGAGKSTGQSSGLQGSASEVKCASLTCRGWTAIPESFFSEHKDQLAQLTGLTISLNLIVELPAEMCLLSALTRLDATNNEIVHIPDAALQLPRLEELELAFNRIAVLPPALGDLTALRRLTLQANQLRELPDSVLVNTSIQHLDVSLNPAFAFRHALHCEHQSGKNSAGGGRCLLPELRTLVCGFTSDRDLCESMTLSTKLKSLSLHLNSLSTLPWGAEGLSTLQKLVLDWNMLSILPSSLSRCSELQYIFLAGNKLTQVSPFLTALSNLKICDLSFNLITSLDVVATWRLLISCPLLESLLLYGNTGLLLPYPARNPVVGGSPEYHRVCQAMPSDLPAYVQWSVHKENHLQETGAERGLGQEVDAEDVGYWSCATRLKWWDLQERFVSTLRASGYQAALTLIYAEGFSSFPPPPQRSRVVVTAVRKFRDTTRVLPPSTSGCWGCTVDTGGRVLVQVREAVLARGPFALIMLTLGHELVHACQILAARKVYNANFREFEAFSWMLLDGAHHLPPISAQDRQWILERVEAHYEALPPYLKTPDRAAHCAAAREAHLHAPVIML